MKRQIVALFALFTIVSLPAAAEYVIEQATFGPDAAYAPSLAVPTDHPYVAIAFLSRSEAIPEQMVCVQMAPVNPYTDEIWPDLRIFGPGSSPCVVWSRDGFTLAYISGDAVLVYQADHAGNWDMDNPDIFYTGPVTGLDLWGDTTEGGPGDTVFMSVDVFIDPPWGPYEVRYAARNTNTGWSYLTTVRQDLPQQPFSQVHWTYGPANPYPAIFYLEGAGDEPHLYSVSLSETGWLPPVLVPGDGGTMPAYISGEFDISGYRDILGLSAQPLCPCRHLYFVSCDQTGGWQPQEQLTVDHGDFDWPHHPRIAAAWNGRPHAFWYQLTSSSELEPLRDHLEYWVRGDETWIDRSDIFAGLTAGVGERVDIDVAPDGDAVVLAWSDTDTLGGVPQPERIFIARNIYLSPVPGGQLPRAAARLDAWPNPFNPRVNLAITLTDAGQVQLDIYDARGRHVQRLHQGVLSADRHEFSWNGAHWNGRPAASGVYFARLSGVVEPVVRKLVLAE